MELYTIPSSVVAPFAAIIPHASDAYAGAARREAYKMFINWAKRISADAIGTTGKWRRIEVQLIANNHSSQTTDSCSVITDGCRQRGDRCFAGEYDCGYANAIRQDIEKYIASSSSLLNKEGTPIIVFVPTIYVSPQYATATKKKMGLIAQRSKVAGATAVAVFALVDFLHYTNAPEPNEYDVPPALLTPPYRDAKTRYEEEFIDTLLLRGGAASIPSTVRRLRRMLADGPRRQWYTCSPGVIIFFLETLEQLLQQLKNKHCKDAASSFHGRVIEYYDSNACEFAGADEHVQRAAAEFSIRDGGSGVLSVCPPTDALYEKYVTAETCFTKAQKGGSARGGGLVVTFVSYCTIVYGDSANMIDAASGDKLFFNAFDIRYMFGLMYSVLINELQRLDKDSGDGIKTLGAETPHVPCWSPWGAVPDSDPSAAAGVFVGTSFAGRGTNCSYGRFEEDLNNRGGQDRTTRGHKILSAVRDCIRDSRDRWRMPITLVTLPNIDMKIELLSPRARWKACDSYDAWSTVFDITSAKQGTYLETTSGASATFLPSVAREFYKNGRNSSHHLNTATAAAAAAAAKKAYMEALVQKAGTIQSAATAFKRAYVYSSDAIYNSNDIQIVQ